MKILRIRAFKKLTILIKILNDRAKTLIIILIILNKSNVKNNFDN